MREIKFRAWNESMYRMDFFGLGDIVPYYYDQFDMPVRYEVMQYTGLKDKNGKEIYEGDIVVGQYEHYDPGLDGCVKDEKMGGEVYWDSHQWAFKAIQHLCDKDREGKVNYFYLMDEKEYWAPQIFEDMEVIGNIYENPDLLEIK